MSQQRASRSESWRSSGASAGGDRAFQGEGVDDLGRGGGVFGFDAGQKGEHVTCKERTSLLGPGSGAGVAENAAGETRPISRPANQHQGEVAAVVGLIQGHQDAVTWQCGEQLREKRVVAAFQPQERRDSITTVCTDMWEGYGGAVEEVLLHTTIVVDRFRVARHYRKAVDELRKQEVRRLREELGDDEQEHLKRILWLFRKQTDDLSEAEQERLDTLFKHSPALETAYRRREELTVIFDTARSKADGLRRLRFWRQRVEWSKAYCSAAKQVSPAWICRMCSPPKQPPHACWT